MASIGTINPGTGRVIKNQAELDKINAQQAKLLADAAAQKRAAANAPKRGYDSTFEDRYAKQQADKAAANAAAQAERNKIGQDKMEVKGNLNQPYEQTYQSAVELFGEDFARNNAPRTIEEAINKQLADREALFAEEKARVQEVNQLEDRELQMADQGTQASKAGVRATLAQGREGAVSTGNMATSEKAQNIMQKRYDLNADQVRSAQEQRNSYLAKQEKAMREGKVEMAETYGNLAAAAETKIRESKAALLEGEATSLAETRAIMAQQDAAVKTAQAGFANIAAQIDTGTKFTNDQLLSMAQVNGVPFEAVLDYYSADDQGRLAMQENKKREAEGIVNSQLQTFDYIRKLRQEGAPQETIDMVLDIAGIPRENDPLRMAQIKKANAEAALANAQATGQAPIPGSSDYYDLEMKKLDLKKAEAEYNEEFGLEGDTFGDFDTYVSSLGTLTQNPDTPTSYIAGRKTHGGYDIAGKKGSNIPAFVAGTVVETGTGNKGWGNYVVVEDAQGNKHRYAHLQDVGANKGDIITAGGSIGTMGNTGNVFGETGVHLHYEVKDSNGKLIDPKSLEQVSGGKAMGKELTTQLKKYAKNKSQAEEIGQDVNYFLENDNIEGLKTYTTGLVTESLPAERRNAIELRTQIVGKLDYATQLMKEYEKAGGDLGVFSGTKLKAQNKIGEMTNPKAQEIGLILLATLEDYGRAQTGAAIQDSENVKFNAIMPSIFDGKDLSTAKFNAFAKGLELDVKNTIEPKIGKDLYEQIYLSGGEEAAVDVADNPWATIDTTPDLTVGQEDYTPDDIASLFDSVIKKR